VNTIGQHRVERLAAPAQGYAGWLLTNPQFLQEHDSLFQTWREEVARQGIPLIGATRSLGLLPEAVRQAEGRTAEYLTAFEEFFLRWLLTGLAAPRLPQPLQPQLSALSTSTVLGYMRGGGYVFCFPDISPIPSRDELREMIEDALRGAEAPEHLADWMDKVRADNAARNTITRYARLFDLQHYLRALHQRHHSVLHRRKSSVIQAFATFFQVSSDTIAGDLDVIDKRLGKEWFLATPGPASPNP
jgi:hypothetical protein